jgi:arylsulfatase A-like enzyme
MRTLGLCLFGITTLILTTATCRSAESPNIVLIFVDDMGYGDPHCFNSNSKIPTPCIDRLAEEGMRFTDAHAPGSLCHPSRYGLLTGRYPFRTKLPWRREPCIPAERMTIASLLRDNGYRTAMVGKWHLGFHVEDYDNPPSNIEGGPADRGFDFYFGIPASTDIPPYYYIHNKRVVALPTGRIEDNRTEGWSPIQGAFWRAGGKAPGLDLIDVLPKFTDTAIDVLTDHHRQNAGQPLFLYLAYPAPHTPWLPTDEFVGKSKASLYGDFTAMVDHMIGRVLTALDKMDMAEDTMVIFTSDNGPVWYDADVERLGHDSAGPWRGMKGDAWEAGHRMPFVVRWPGKVARSSVSNQTICHTDLMSTFADLLEVDLPDDAGEDSFTLLPELLGERRDEPLRPAMITSSANGTLAIRQGPWKLITALGSGGFSKPSRVPPVPGGPSGQLYNLNEDPGESNNLWSAKPDIVQRLTRLLEQTKASGRSR